MKTLENNLPELTGSEKQIAWALDIRNASLPIAKELELDDLVAKLTTETSAKWFIEADDLRPMTRFEKKDRACKTQY